MRHYFEVEQEDGLPYWPERDLFLDNHLPRAEQIMTALDGLRVCTAMALLEQCKQAVLQSKVNFD